MVSKKAADALLSMINPHTTPPAVAKDPRRQPKRQPCVIKALREQLAAGVLETEAMRKELNACKAALADLNNSHKELIQTHATTVLQLKEVQTAATEAQWTQDPMHTPINLNEDMEQSEVTSAGPTPNSSCHPDLLFSPPTQEHIDMLMVQSHGRPDRYGCLLFRAVVPDQRYAEWASTTNWDGLRGKVALPVNLKQFVRDSVIKRYPNLTSADSKRIKDRVNEFLRSPRTSVSAHRRLQY
ncbi:uncharacterized protein [Danio rerio]|uniref:Uncharacterized protein n=1 Tax=Danio rerio TaxID=7955 RepID=A0AC58GIM6_DANRE